MPSIDLIITAAHAFTMTGEGVGYLADGALAVDRGRILAVGPRAAVEAEYRAAETIAGRHHVMLPGFIDAHMHTADGLLRGLAQDTRNWMMHGVGPFDAHLNRATRDAGNRLAVVEGLRAGTTTFGEFGADVDPVGRFARDSGIRLCLTVKIREARQRIYAPGELYELDPSQGRRSLEEALAAADAWHGRADGRISVLLGPQGPDFVGRDLLLEIRRHALRRNTRIHMHVQQGVRETDQIRMRYGQRPIAWLDGLGYLDQTLIAVHLTDADEEEAARVAQRGAGMVLCSGSIGIIDGIVPPALAFQRAGGAVALGSDQAPGNNCHNIFNEMKLTALFNKIRAADPEVMPAWRVLRMATIEGAQVLGLEDAIGSLSAGKRADVILVDLHRPTLTPVHTEPMRNLVPNLVYSARGDEVSDVVVDGRPLMRAGRLTTIDETAVLAAARELAPALGRAAGPAFHRIDGTNAQFMRSGKL